MAIPIAMMAAGAFLRATSTYMANRAQAETEIDNAIFYERQAQFAREAMSREALISRRKFSATLGAQIGAFAKGGVSVTEGSSVGVLANTLAQQSEELDAIIKKGNLESDLAMGRAQQARSRAMTLKSDSFNVMQGVSSLLSMGGS